MHIFNSKPSTSLTCSFMYLFHKYFWSTAYVPWVDFVVNKTVELPCSIQSKKVKNLEEKNFKKLQAK
jgi:hypothetical protein